MSTAEPGLAALLTSDVAALPDVGLSCRGPVTAAFIARGVGELRAAARYLRDLPYGRVSDRERPVLVLDEGRGTCTTKHALLAELALEQGVDLALTVGVYAMTEANTPGVGAVLAAHALDALPEAHCYVTWQGRRVDITRTVTGAAPITGFLHEERITPAQIGAWKIALHRRVLAAWLRAAGSPLDLDAAWAIREACIAALAEPR